MMRAKKIIKFPSLVGQGSWGRYSLWPRQCAVIVIMPVVTIERYDSDAALVDAFVERNRRRRRRKP